MFTYSILSILLILPLSNAAIVQDEVKNLPGSDFQPNFKHYSGYLNGSKTNKLHYWFVESQGNPIRDPLVLWLNGGPGCSSMDGMLTEHGPFRVSSNGSSISLNKWSWNRLANVLYIESPAGVGYSYNDEQDYRTSDDEVAGNNHEALKYFFKNYPEFSQNELYLTGESYGGIYIPTLAMLVMKDSSMNFKGIAVGNGMSDYSLNDRSLVYFGYFHGLWGQTLMTKIIKNCCKNGSISDCTFDSGKVTAECSEGVTEAGRIISELNVYNMYASCYKGSQRYYLSAFSKESKTKERFSSHLVMSSGSQLFKEHSMKFYAKARSGEGVELSPPCVDARGITAYLNRDDVKAALHMPSNLPEWSICSDAVSSLYNRQYTSMFNQYKRLTASGNYKVLVYNGDIDMACNYLMDEWFVDSLGLATLDDYKSWNYQDLDGSEQIGGYVKHFQNQVVFATVRGAGHMVPTDRPIPAYTMFKAFIEGKHM